MAGLTRLSQQTRLGLTGVRLFSSAHQVPFFPQICMLCTCVFCLLRIWVCDSNGQTHAACVSHRRSNSACLEEVPLHDTRYTWQSHCLEVLFCDWHDQTHCAACASYRRSTLACPPRLRCQKSTGASCAPTRSVRPRAAFLSRLCARPIVRTKALAPPECAGS